MFQAKYLAVNGLRHASTTLVIDWSHQDSTPPQKKKDFRTEHNNCDFDLNEKSQKAIYRSSIQPN